MTNDYRSFGFDQILRAESAVQRFTLNSPRPVEEPDIQNNGWLFRTSGIATDPAEEAGYRDGAFGYVTVNYGRWENLESRLIELFEKPLGETLLSVALASVRLEYWDSFVFEGAPDQASVNALLSSLDTAIPAKVAAGENLFHSHAGWFDNSDYGQVLINRNVDVVDVKSEDGILRTCTIFTLAEQRGLEEISDFLTVKEVLRSLHRKSLYVFGSTLTADKRSEIGLNLEDYQ